MDEQQGAGIEHRHLRSALEFAILMAAEGQKRKPALPFPKDLKPLFNKARLPNSALGRLRRCIEGDSVFRTRLSAGALPELVDEIGQLWLAGDEGWEQQASVLASVADAAVEDVDLKTQLKRAEKRREAAEQAAVRAQAKLVHRDEVVQMQSTEIEDLRAELVKSEEIVFEIRTELLNVRMDVRHACDREAAAEAKWVTVNDQLTAARRQPALQQPALPEPVRDNSAEVAAAASAARALAEQLEALLSAPTAIESRAQQDRDSRPANRTPVSLPGGVIGSSSEAAEHLARSDALMLIDGYNVAKLGWPNRPLERQRAALLDALENLAGRFGTDVTVVFDGASIVGAYADRRRLIRVVYSPEGVIADDVIRDEVKRLPTNRSVVVVTNDAEIVRDVRADGANVVPSNALLAIL
jgi:predicted RNA-binding protein with PIN domain